MTPTGYPTVADDGHVALTDDHPGVADPAYRARRDAIAALSSSWHPGGPVPTIAYTDGEHATWAEVRVRLEPLWRAHAAQSFLDGVEALGLPVDEVPQLSEVTASLSRAGSAFTYLPVAGLAPLRDFYSSFGSGVFFSTQYLRHHSRPLYTPEPDICHEVLGHAHQLADPAVAALYRTVAATTARLETAEALGFLSRVFWRTVEFGVVASGPGSAPQAWGAGLLSSFGEMRSLGSAEVRPVDLQDMGTAAYDITRYQTELYCAPSMSWYLDDLPAWLEAFDDDAALRAAASSAASAA